MATPRRLWGPLAMVGVAVGIFLTGTPVMLDLWHSSAAWFGCCLVPPVVGAALVMLPGPGRQFGAGLLASALTIPMFVLSWPIAAFLL